MDETTDQPAPPFAALAHPAAAAAADSRSIPHCLGCYYTLIGLPEPRCPECGRWFNPADPNTYTVKPPFVRWRYWLPGWTLSLGAGLCLYLAVVGLSGWGWAAALVLPFCLGVLLGYGVRVRWLVIPLLVLLLLCSLVLGLVSMQVAGLFCGLILAGIVLGPILVGTACGVALRAILKHSRFDQRWHLPTLVCLIAPMAAAVVERVLWVPPGVESVRTSIVVPAPVDRAWAAMGFYEQTPGDGPRVLRLPGMPRPLSTSGGVGRVGDRTVCVYDKGRLVKQVTAREENRRLAFKVVEQGFERHSFALTGGSFTFDPIDADHTRVTLETAYRPIMRPRWCWQPFEAWTVHALHGHVLDGMVTGATTPRGPDAPPPASSVALGEDRR